MFRVLIYHIIAHLYYIQFLVLVEGYYPGLLHYSGRKSASHDHSSHRPAFFKLWELFCFLSWVKYFLLEKIEHSPRRYISNKNYNDHSDHNLEDSRSN